MIGAKVSVQKTDRTAILNGLLDKIKALEVYVGIPEENAAREGDGLNNAQIAFLNTQGVRSSEMRKEMKPDLDAGRKYSEAFSLYVESHGSPLWHIPPRPIIEPAIEAPGNKEKIAGELAAAMKAVLEGDHEKAIYHLELAGQYGENAARDWFEDPRNEWPPNAPATIDAKGSDRPLVDTGELRKSITHIVKENS